MNVARTVDAGWSIPIGTPIFDVVGERIGRVVGADLQTLTLTRGRILPTTLSIPLSLVDRYENGKLYLAVTAERVFGRGR